MSLVQRFFRDSAVDSLNCLLGAICGRDNMLIATGCNARTESGTVLPKVVARNVAVSDRLRLYIVDFNLSFFDCHCFVGHDSFPLAELPAFESAIRCDWLDRCNDSIHRQFVKHKSSINQNNTENVRQPHKNMGNYLLDFFRTISKISLTTSERDFETVDWDCTHFWLAGVSVNEVLMRGASPISLRPAPVRCPPAGMLLSPEK